MAVPTGAGFGFYVGGSPSSGITQYLMNGADALKAVNIFKLFEAIKGRKATPQEIANMERTLEASDDVRK
jgi:hypothetical protein